MRLSRNLSARKSAARGAGPTRQGLPARQAIHKSVGVAVLLVAIASPVVARTFALFDRTFTRRPGQPVVETFNFNAPQTIYRLRVESDRAASAIIVLNGRRVVGTSDFNGNVTLIERSVELNPSNVMTVELRGQPGGTLRVRLIGDDDGPPFIRATAAPPPNPSGWNNTDVRITFECD